MAVRRTARHHCASIAVLNTNVSAATSFLTCTCLDVIFFGRPSVIGAVQSMMAMSIAGLVCITASAAVQLNYVGKNALKMWIIRQSL